MSSAAFGEAPGLNEQEQRLLGRLLSDPQSIPNEFKTWMIAYLEGSDLTLPISSIVGLSGRLPAPTDVELRSGHANVGLDERGRAHVDYDNPVSETRGVQVTPTDEARPTIFFSALDWDENGFSVRCWDPNTNQLLANAPTEFFWQALVIP